MYLPLPFAVVPMMVLPLVSGAALASESKLLGREATLWSGAQDVSVSMHPRGTETAIGVNCKGSTLCRNSLANDCSAAYSNIRAGNIYTGGNAGSSGACSGHCGIFLQGTNGQSSGSCSYPGSQLQTSYNNIRNGGCAACGSEVFSNGCEVTINYVTGC